MAKKRAPHSVDPAEIEKNAENLPQLIFAKTLNRLMEERGIDQEKMSADLGLSTGIIHNYRHGKTEPKLASIIKIAEYLHVDCHYLLTGVSSKNVTVSKDLGLNEKSIEVLKSHHDLPSTSVLNDLLVNDSTTNLLALINEYKKIQQFNKEEIELCHNIIQEVEAGIELGTSSDILKGRISIPAHRLIEIEPNEGYIRFSVIDNFTKLLDTIYPPTDFSEARNMVCKSRSIIDLFNSDCYSKDE